MAFADTTPRTIVEAWGATELLLAAAAKTGQLLGVSSNTWILAEASTPVLAAFVAGTDGASGDTITAYRGAYITAEFNATAGQDGDVLYLSDTGGTIDTSAGSTTQVLGWIVDEDKVMLCPRNPLQIDASDIANDSIDSAHYVAGSIDAEHLAANSVTSTKIAANSVVPTGINAAAVTTAKIADSGVTPTKLSDSAVGRVVVTIIADTSADTFEAYSPVAGDVVAVQFINESGAAFTTLASLTVGSYTTVCAATGNTLADGVNRRDTSITAGVKDVSAGTTLAFLAGTTAGSDLQWCLVEIEYKLNAIG